MRVPARSRRGWMWLLTSGVLVLGSATPRPAEAQAVAVPHRAPDFRRLDQQHRPVTLKALHGKVILLNFWATWCGPCLAEMPVFDGWQQQYRSRGLQVVGVSMDDEAAAVTKVAARLHLDYPVVMGDAQLGSAYGGVLGLPVTFLIGRNGMVLKRYEGAADLKGLQREVEAALSAR